MTNEKKIHTFVICAYKESPYLEECIKSINNQVMKSEIIMTTSTPNDLIKNVAKKYNIKLIINKNSNGCVDDFNFAFNQAKTKYVTLCHQDDIYLPNFSQKTVSKLEKNKNSLLSFTNYYEKRDDKIKKYSLMLIIKRIMNFPLLFLGKHKRVRRFILSLGNSICAPSVTFNKELLDNPWKKSDFKFNLDWDTWLDLAEKHTGNFVYISKPLMYHRIHTGSNTSSAIENDIVTEENYAIFKRYWSEKNAKFLTKLYKQSEKSNKIKKKRNVNT